MKPWLVILGAITVAGACAHDATAPPNIPPRLILLDSLRAVNDTALPCCSISGGMLAFYYPAHPTNYVETPGGRTPAACVVGIPDGERISDLTGLAVSAAGDTIPLFACTTGEFRLALRGTMSGPETVISAGYYSWSPDSLWHSGSLVLVDTIGGTTRTTAVASGVIQVPIGSRAYDFRVIHGAEY